MEIYQITASVKKGNEKAKFCANQKIGLEKSIFYKNIDEAKGAPIVQQLFYLPFVKSVSLEEKCLIVERFDILKWVDVIEEVRLQLQKYLNDGGVILEQMKFDKVPVSVYVESTPNPSVMKFVTNKSLVKKSVEFKNIDDTKNSPLAQKLFNFPFVKEVFISSNYVSISKYDVVTWDEVVMEIREIVRSFIEEGNSIFSEDYNFIDDKNIQPKKNLNSLEQQIISILDEYIKPAVASDGGNIEFDSYDASKKSVKVILQGACSGCPSSTFTLKNGIENMLKEMIPDKIENVEAING